MIHPEKALEVVRRLRRDEDVVITTMSSAKIWMDMGPAHPLDMVFVPSCMGHATSWGLGVALAQPSRRVIVFNGDGSMLMNLGSLVTIAAEAPANLVVIIMDNGVYEVTGAQPVPHRPDFAGIARAAGISNVARFATEADWRANAKGVLEARGPAVVVLEIEADANRAAPKSPGPASERATVLRSALAEASPVKSR
jgi:thiamine pyrophosphate-dependent acetolactate synthase large subunit-like protein